jgi:diguanylate cyclase (GGDEF)-like protein
MDDEALDEYRPIVYYAEIISLFNTSFEEEKLLNLFDALAQHYITLDTPYIIISNETNNLKTLLVKNIENFFTGEMIMELFSLFNNINNRIAKIYLREYIHKLKSLNNVRINSLSDLIDKHLLIHYEAHLMWLSQLATSIEQKEKTKFPEMNATLCAFGKWLADDAKFIIRNNSKYKAINTLHENLHLFAEKIYQVLPSNEHHVIITYLEKCEMLSLSIGTELALIDNILMNDKVIKDPLTGALNRQALSNIFKNQYELALATSNHFILAMCDLDYFKEVNDTYGHIFGDNVLIKFVAIVKENIRHSDIILRYGGEEFIIILPAINQESGLKVLEKIRNDFHDFIFSVDNKEFQSSVSIGFVEVKPQEGYKQHFLNDYVGVADQKLYSAKTNGRNRIEHC